MAISSAINSVFQLKIHFNRHPSLLQFHSSMSLAYHHLHLVKPIDLFYQFPKLYSKVKSFNSHFHCSPLTSDPLFGTYDMFCYFLTRAFLAISNLCLSVLLRYS